MARVSATRSSMVMPAEEDRHGEGRGLTLADGAVESPATKARDLLGVERRRRRACGG